MGSVSNSFLLTKYPLPISPVTDLRVVRTNQGITDSKQLSILHGYITDVEASIACLKRDIRDVQTEAETLQKRKHQLLEREKQLWEQTFFARLNGDIRRVQSEAKTLQERTHQLLEHEKQLQERKAQLKELQHTHARFISIPPLLRVPSDVLIQILEYRMPKFPEEDDGDSLAVVELLLKVTQICSQCREVAISHPKFWSQIVISAYGSQLSNDDWKLKVRRRVQTWLERSRNNPLSVDISISSRSGFTPGDVALFMEPVLGSSHRWSRLNLHVDLAMFPAVFLGAKQLDLPVLTHLTVESSSESRNADVEAPPGSLRDFKIFENIPQLSALTLWEMEELDRAQLPLPWMQIRQVKIKSKFDESIFEKAPNLHTFRTDCGSEFSLRDPFFRHRSDQLRVLHIEIQEMAMALLPRLTLPHLEELTILNELDLGIPWNHEMFLDFLGKTSGSIRRLTMASLDIESEDDLLQILQSDYVPNLEHLHIALSFITDKLLDSIFLTNDNEHHGHARPALRSLILQGQSVTDRLNGDHLIDLIQSRQAGPQKLQSVTVFCNILTCVSQPALESRFARLKTGMVELKITSGYFPNRKTWI